LVITGSGISVDYRLTQHGLVGVENVTIRRQLWDVSFSFFDPNYGSVFYLLMDPDFNTLTTFRSHFFNIAEAKHSTRTSVTPTNTPISSSPRSNTISGSQGAGIAIGSLAGFILILCGVGYILRKRGIPLLHRKIPPEGRQELDAADTEKHQRPTELGGNPLSEAEGAIEIYELER